MIFRTQLEANIYELIKPSVLGMGYDVVRIRMASGKRNKNLQIMMERADKKPFTVDNCEEVSHHLLRVLNVEELIEGDYNLEISSAGVDKPLTRIKDFEEAVSKFVKIASRVPLNNQKNFMGQIISFNNEVVELKLVDPENIVKIPFVDILDANIEYFYESNKLKKINKKPKKGVKKS